MQELGKTENHAHCLQREAAYILRLREAGLVMSLKGCLHAVLSSDWGTGCRCNTKRMRLNITLSLWWALGGLPLQIEKPGPPPQLKRKLLTISLLERNIQAGLLKQLFHHCRPICVMGECIYSVQDSEVHSMCWWVFIAHGAQQGLCLLHCAAQTHALHSSEQREGRESKVICLVGSVLLASVPLMLLCRGQIWKIDNLLN